MKQRDEAYGKISDHFKGVGTVTHDMVAQRAREIALINGRDPNHYNKDDFLEAKRELTGVPLSSESDEEESLSAITEWAEEPGASGHPVEKSEPPDEQTIAERLVEEGVEEAEHEQMVEGAKKRET